jgi:hypothetical protein
MSVVIVIEICVKHPGGPTRIRLIFMPHLKNINTQETEPTAGGVQFQFSQGFNSPHTPVLPTPSQRTGRFEFLCVQFLLLSLPLCPIPFRYTQ